MSQSPPPPDDEEPWRRPRFAWLWDALLFVALCGLYTLSSTTTMQGHDNPEWVSIMELGGTAHPPGYPLYTLLLRLWGRIPHDNPFAHAALLSSVIMALAAVMLTHALEERNGHSYTARLGALCWATTLPVWRWAGVAEVVALTSLTAAFFIWAVHRVDNAEEIKPRHGLLLGVALGLGVAHHHSLAMLLPLVITHVFRSHVGAGVARWWKAILSGLVGGTVVALGLYALSASWPSDPRAEHFSSIHDLPSLFHSLFRREYGTFSSSGRAGSWSIRPSWDLLVDVLTGTHLMVFLAAIALTGRRAWMTFVCFLLAGPWLLGGFTVLDAEGQMLASLETRERFHALPLMLVVVMASDATAAAAWQLPRRRGMFYTRALGGILTVAVLLGASARLMNASWKGEYAVDDTFRAALSTAPRDALVVTTGDAWQMGFTLMALQLHREDLTQLTWPRAFNGLKPDENARALLSPVCSSWPCPQDEWHSALMRLSEKRPVVFFPATSAARVMRGEPLSVETMFSRLGPSTMTLEEQANALQAFQERATLRASLDDPRRYWERHALAVWAAPWLILMDAAQKAGNQPLHARAQQAAMAIMARIQPP